MKIFSFPFLVIDEIMKQLEPVELIALSLCSKNAHAFMKTFAKTSQDLQIEHYYHDDYIITYPGHSLMVVMSNQSRFRGLSDLKTIHGLNYCFNQTGRLYTVWKDVDQGCRESANYICDLFKIPVATILVRRESDLWLLDFVRQRQERKLRNVNVCTLDVSMSAEGYSSIMSFNATERLEVTPMPPGKYRFDGKLPAAKTLIIQWGHWITREHLLGLESSFAQLSYIKLTRSDIRALLRVWLNGGLPNLKYLDIYGRPLDNQIYNGIRDRMEPVGKEISYKWDKFKSAVKFNSNAFHIRRDDGVVATVRIDGRKFTMAVWPDINGNRV